MQASATNPWDSSVDAPGRGGRGRDSRGRGRSPRARGRAPHGGAPHPQTTAPAISQPPPAAKPQDADPAPPRGHGRGFRGRGRGRPISSGEIVKTEPTFIKARELAPEERGLNLKLVACGLPTLIKHLRYGDGKEEKEWSVEAGDETGTINVRVTSAEVAEKLRDGVAIVIRNGFVEMVERKFMRLAVDLFGKIALSDAPHPFRPDLRTRHSDTEYEKE